MACDMGVSGGLVRPTAWSHGKWIPIELYLMKLKVMCQLPLKGQHLLNLDPYWVAREESLKKPSSK
ncbi:Protein MCM10 [Gossypium australe]|uniref:Protein MCM10 n=1 Tax=Gossypium australe TaxID=47621 RepID=A0A5B6VL16_9ROSI|nr:Protein MCM10 [Gossypium australe]